MPKSIPTAVKVINPVRWRGRKEGNVLFNDALNTFYLRLYGVEHMVKAQVTSPHPGLFSSSYIQANVAEVSLFFQYIYGGIIVTYTYKTYSMMHYGHRLTDTGRKFDQVW